MKYFLRVLFTPSCWIQNEPFSKSWDRKLNELMRAHKFERVTQHVARLGPVLIWIANHPYSSFTPNYKPMARPRRATILKAWDKLHAEIHN